MDRGSGAGGWRLAVVVLRGMLIAGAGGFLFDLLHFPAAWVAGSTVAVAIAVLVARVPVFMPDRLRDVIFVFLGISMGAGVTPETIERLPDWPASLALLLVTVVAVTAGTYAFFRVVGGWDHITAVMASIPGALSYVMAVAIEQGADLRRVAIAQSVRILFLVVVLPLAVVGSGSGAGGGPARAPEGSWRDLALLVGCGAAAGLAFARLRVPAGFLTGAFAASALLHGAGVVAANLPAAILIPCFLGIGVVIGQRFAGTDRALLRSTFGLALGGFAIGGLLAALGALATVAAIAIGWGQAALAFAPGGLEAMTALSFALAVDPAYVAAHQIFRFVGIALFMPMTLAWLDRRRTRG